MKLKIISIFLSALCISSFVYSQEHEEDHKKQDKHNHYHKHHLALFNGATTNFTHSSTDYSLGIDYELRLTKTFGLGLLGEYIFTDNGEFIAGVPAFLHFAKSLKITGAPLLIYKEEHIDDHTHHNEANMKTIFAFRVGISYGFHLGKLAVAPAINFDMGESSALVYGLNIGIGF
jgi:hypothetical protein